MKNRKVSKRSSEKQFIKTMIITGVIGLSVMMVTMIYVIKIFGTKNVSVAKEDQIAEIVKKDVIKEDTTTRGVVYEKQHQNIKIWDIKQEEYIKINVDNKTSIKDGYGKPMTIGEIEKGEIIEVTYDTKSKDASEIQKSSVAWTKTQVNGATIDIQNKTIIIGNDEYNYTSNLIITNDSQEVIDINSIGQYDTLMIKGTDKTVWSINIMESPGYIKFSQAPSQEGTIEIDNNRIYMLEEVKEPIPLSIGTHKIVVQIKGYEPLVKNVDITKDTVYNFNLKDMKQATSNLNINVTNTAKTYNIQIDNKRYKKGDAITLPAGEYILKITADEFETYEQKIQLEAGDQLINIALTPKADETNKKDKDKDNNKDSKEQDEIKTVQIIIETEPVGAQVYVNGVHKGTTPTLTGLKPGEYNISIEKEGYLPLSTIIVVDGSSSQRAFLYTLQKE